MDINLSSINSSNISNLNISTSSKMESTSFKDTLNNAIENGEDEKLKEASKEFETYFLNMMMKSMRKTIVSSEGIFKKSKGEELFTEMLDEEMCKNLSSAGGVGLADMIYEQLSNNNKI